MNLDFEVEVLGMATPRGGYPGEFSPTVIRIINHYIAGYSEVLHLFSGSSTIGKDRVDVAHGNATHHMDVISYLATASGIWDYVILDPPYNISRKDKKLLGYGKTEGMAGNVAMRRIFEKWSEDNVWRVLWLDKCAPLWRFFKRVKVWFFFPGGYADIRVLSLLENKTLSAPKPRNLLSFMNEPTT